MKSLILLAAFFCGAFFGIAPGAHLAQDKSTGGAKGTVKSVAGKPISGVAVEVKQDGKTVANGRTDNKGNFSIVGLKPNVYIFVFTKTGLSEGVSKPLEIKANTVATLKRLILTVDPGALAIIRGSVFDHDGRIARNVKVEILRVTGDGTKRIGERFTDINGEFGLRLPPEPARYRFVVKSADGAPTNKDLEIDGAEVYRFAVSLKPVKSEQ